MYTCKIVVQLNGFDLTCDKNFALVSFPTFLISVPQAAACYSKEQLPWQHALLLTNESSLGRGKCDQMFHLVILEVPNSAETVEGPR